MKMKPLSLSRIAQVTGGTYVGDDALKDTLITGVVRDNREVAPGNLFACIPGAKVDGHSFADSAYAAGAAGCLAEKALPDPKGPYILVDSTLRAVRALGAYYRSLFDIPVIGVTGSVGKTTAKEMVSAVLEQKFRVHKTAGNLNNELGVPLTILGLREEHQAAIIEMGISDFGEMSRLAEIVRPTLCLMTTIGYCHLENLGDLDGVLRAKSEVYAYMAPDSLAVVNGDDEKLAALEPGVRKITFGFDPKNDFWAENIENKGYEGVVCDLCTEGSRSRVQIPALGNHMVLSALAAAAVGKQYGLSDEEIRRGIAQYRPVGGRANVCRTAYLTIIDDCYNANPNSVTASLLSLSTLEGRRIAILGDMMELGVESVSLHRQIGAFAGKCKLDGLICCGKMAEYIYKGLIASGADVPAWHFPMQEALLSVLPSLVREGDNVLVKASHGMHFEKITEELKKLI